MRKKFRFRLWMMLVAVAVLASAIELSGVPRRWRSYRRGAADTEVTARSCRALIRECEEKAAGLRSAAKLAGAAEAVRLIREAEDEEGRAEGWRQLAAWNERTGDVYREAAARPWGTRPDCRHSSRARARAIAAAEMSPGSAFIGLHGEEPGSGGDAEHAPNTIRTLAVAAQRAWMKDETRTW